MDRRRARLRALSATQHGKKEHQHAADRRSSGSCLERAGMEPRPLSGSQRHPRRGARHDRQSSRTQYRLAARAAQGRCRDLHRHRAFARQRRRQALHRLPQPGHRFRHRAGTARLLPPAGAPRPLQHDRRSARARARIRRLANRARYRSLRLHTQHGRRRPYRRSRAMRKRGSGRGCVSSASPTTAPAPMRMELAAKAALLLPATIFCASWKSSASSST